MDTIKFPRVDLFGIQICRLGMDDTVRLLTAAVQSGEPHHVVTANPIMVMKALEDERYGAVMRSAPFVVPDGTGIVWAASYVGVPVKERVTGFDLLHKLMEVGEHYQWRVYILGAQRQVVEQAVLRLKQQYPSVQIVGWRDGFFCSEEDERVIDAIRETRPHLLFVARGVDTQEPWIGKYKSQLNVPLMMGIGGSLDIISGRCKRAPTAWQKLRIEWLYRLIKEPKRATRMLALPKFVCKVMALKRATIRCADDTKKKDI